MARPSFQLLADYVQQRLSPGRFLHVLGVTHVATFLAMRNDADVELAAIAGLSHDRSKPLSAEDIRTDLERRGISIPQEDCGHPAVWHGLHAATVLRQDYGMSDKDGEDVCGAVAVHTTADRDMSLLGKILFVADYTEPTRDFADAPELRRISRVDLEEAFRQCLRSKCRHVLERKRQLSPRAIRALDCYGVAV